MRSTGPLAIAAEAVRRGGRHGDTRLVHVNPGELAALERLWGPPTINPVTGLPEYLDILGAIGSGLGALSSGDLGNLSTLGTPGSEPTGLIPDLLTPAVFDSGRPVPRTVLERLLCDADLTRIVFGPDSQLLDVGRTQRTYPAHLRRAIIARDKHCQYPGCHAPPHLCQCHHSQHWARDHGTTDARTGILLCYHHHPTVHDNGIEIHWKPGHGWQFTNRHGQPLLRE